MTNFDGHRFTISRGVDAEDVSIQFLAKCRRCEAEFTGFPEELAAREYPDCQPPDSAFMLSDIDPRMRRIGSTTGTSQQRYAQAGRSAVDEIFGTEPSSVTTLGFALLHPLVMLRIWWNGRKMAMLTWYVGTKTKKRRA